MKRPLAYITAAWCGSDHENTKLAAQYCRTVYEAGFSPICPTLYQPLFLNDAVPEEHKSGIDMGRDLLRRSHVLVVCGHTVTEAMKNDIAVAQRLGITATTLEIGNRKGLAGEKSSLFFQAIRIIREMREATNGLFPAIAVWENVIYVLKCIRDVMSCKQL